MHCFGRFTYLDIFTNWLICGTKFVQMHALSLLLLIYLFIYFNLSISFLTSLLTCFLTIMCLPQEISPDGQFSVGADCDFKIHVSKYFYPLNDKYFGSVVSIIHILTTLVDSDNI